MIKNVVIIDDSNYKVETITGYIQKIIPDCTICAFEFINSALLYLHNNKDNIISNPKEWLIISDMVMPRYRRGYMEQYGGRQVLRELQRLKFKCPVILQSSDALDYEQYKKDYSKLIGTVKESAVVYNLSTYENLIKEFL